MRKVVRTLAGIVTFAIVLTAMPNFSAAAETVAQTPKASGTAASQSGAVAQPATPAETAPKEQPVVANRIVEVRTSITVRNVLPDVAKDLTIVLPPTVTNKIGTQRVLSVKFMTEPTWTRETPGGPRSHLQGGRGCRVRHPHLRADLHCGAAGRRREGGRGDAGRPVPDRRSRC